MMRILCYFLLQFPFQINHDNQHTPDGKRWEEMEEDLQWGDQIRIWKTAGDNGDDDDSHFVYTLSRKALGLLLDDVDGHVDDADDADMITTATSDFG